ncbi:zinc finger protein 252-like [Penaeus indicus]|uniref:zinc finger protein 252-like n=1 Tax=Penaeus indicus TaxID=29960 RepID=UPI00300D6140
MVDLGGGPRERFQSLTTDETEEVLPAVSTVGYYSHTYNVPRSSPWRHAAQNQDPVSRHNLLEAMHNDLIQIKSDPETVSRLCTSTSSLSSIPSAIMSSMEAAEDVRAKGQLLQEITREAETFERYSPSPAPVGCYRSYSLAPEPQQAADAEYICTFADAPEWSWSRTSTPGEDRVPVGSTGSGTLIVTSGTTNETVIGSLQYAVPSHLSPDAFSALPSISVAQPPASTPSLSGSPMQRPLPAPSTLTSSALDLSPMTPSPVAHQLPSLQPSLINATSSHLTAVTAPPSAHQLPPLQPSLTSLDMAAHALTSHHALEGTLDLVGVEGDSSNTQDVPADFEPGHECSHCGVLFTRLSHLKHHMKIHMEELNIANTKEDGLMFSSESQDLRKTQRQESPEQQYTCKQCGEIFQRAERLKIHELNHSGERPFKCNECTAAFTAKAMLIRHKKVHTGEKPYSCDECKTCFTESGSLKVHKRMHSGEKPFKCDQCDVAFSGAGMLATHKRKHTGEKPYMCNDCGETFRLLSTLKSHRRRHTGEKPFVCEICDSSFTQRAALQRHKRIHSDQKPWVCDQCGFKFREKENLRKHIALHKIKSQHMCNVCGAGFKQAKKLETHKMLHNGGDRPYRCNKCPSTFTNPKYLTQHKKRVHNRKDSVIQCDVCNATFKRKETLRSHVRIHKGDKGDGVYVCGECDATFNQRGTLTKHIRIHIASREAKDNKSNVFECKTCAKSFHDKKGLDHHLESHFLENANADDVAYSCPICHQGFSSQRSLVKHKRANHPTQRSASKIALDQDADDSTVHIRDKYICEDCDQTFFRRRQLKAHKEFCPCRSSSPQPESPEALTESTPPLQNDSKEVDAMKLLTAVLAVTSADTSDNVNCQQSHARGSSPPPLLSHPPSHAVHRYPSPSVITTQDSLFHQTPQHHTHQLQQSFPQTSVQQLSHQEHMQQPSHSHLQQQSQQLDHLQQHARQQGHMQQQQQSQQHGHMQQLQRQQSQLQQPSQHELQPSTRQQTHLHHSQLHQQVEQETHIQRQNHVHHHHHLQFSHDVQQQFFKPSSLSLSTQHHNHQQQEDILSQHSASLTIPQDLDECSHPHESGHTQQHHLHSHLDQSSLEEHNTNLKHHHKHHHLH